MLRWVQLGTDIDGEAELDHSGYSVSLSADGLTLAIGAKDNSNSKGTNSGHVRIYQYASGAWSQLGLDINGEAANDQSGSSISISADGLTVAIGADLNNASGTDYGHVRIYSYIKFE